MNDKTAQSMADALIDQIESAARASFRRHQSSIKGQILTAADNYDWHLLNAAYQAGIHAMRAQIAEAQRELIAKEAERAGLELERNNAQRQHTMQCAINKTDSQRILELTAENEQLREQRNRIGLCIDRALNGGEKDDHEAGLGGRMDAIRALRAQLAEAQNERDKAIDLLETMFSSYENGTACYEDPEDCSGFVGYAFKMDDLDFNACCDLLNRTRPRAAIDAAKGKTP